MKFLTPRKTVFVLFIFVFLCVFTGCSDEDEVPPDTRAPVDARALDINIADRSELERLPGIGEQTALKIISYRQAHGPFRRPEQLMLVDGISERKFRALRGSVKVSGETPTAGK